MEEPMNYRLESRVVRQNTRRQPTKKSIRGLVFGSLVSGYATHDFTPGFFQADPAFYFDKFARFQILVVFKEVRDLVEQALWQILQGFNVVV
jgi:hypothetical protein